MKMMKPVFLTILAFCCFLSLHGQNTARKDSLMNREMTLEREYSPTLRDAVKIGQFPELREPQAPKSAVEFSNYSTPFDVRSRLSLLSPQSYLARMNYSKNKGYLTGGVSSLIDIDGDFGYQILNTSNDRLNVFFSHRSSSSDVWYLQDVTYLREDGKQQFKINDNWGGFNYLHDFGRIKFLADMKYTGSAFNYYGVSIPYFTYENPEQHPEYNFLKNTLQGNSLFETHFGLASDKDGELNYKLNLGYTNFSQKYGNTTNEDGSKESRLLIDADVSKLINSTTGFGVSGTIKTYNYANDMFRTLNDSVTNYWTYSLNPYFYWEDNNLSLTIGAKMDVEVGGLGKIFLSPAIRLNYNTSEQFMFYLLAEGGRKDNSQYSLFYENRYIDPLIRVKDSRSPLDATIGVKFISLSTLSAGIFGGYKITDDEHFIYSDSGIKDQFNETAPVLAGNWITPVYENANTIKLGAELKYSFQDAFEFGAKGTYYQWTLAAENSSSDLVPHKAWNKPDFEMKVNMAYSSPVLPLRFDLSYLGAFGRKSMNIYRRNFINSVDITNMNDIHDLNLKGTFSITPNFSAYLSLNNLLFSKYDIFWGYPAQDFSIMGGFSVLF